MFVFSILMMGLIECLDIHMAHFGVGRELVGFYMLYLSLVLVL